MQPIFTNILVLLLAGGLALISAQSRIMQQVDESIYDFNLNLQPFTTVTSPREKNAVVVIAIDDRTLEAFPEPLVLWHHYLAVTLDGLRKSRAKVIALDIIPAISLDTLSPDYDRLLFQAMREAGKNNTPVILGYDASENGLLPHRKFMLAAANIAYLNLWPDKDGVIRQYQWFLENDNQKKNSISREILQQVGNINEPAISQKFYINYKQANIPVYSFLDVYQQLINNNSFWLDERFANKQVLVGLGTTKLKDNHRVPVYGNTNLMAGVLIHAYALKSIVTDNYYKNLPVTWQALLFVILVLLSGVVFLTIAPGKAFVLIVLTGLSVVVGHYVMLSNNLVWSMSLPVSAIILPAIVCGLYRYGFEYRKYRQLQKHFKRYVNDEVLQQIISSRDDPGFQGRKVEVSVMFADIRNYTSMSEQMAPADIVSGLNKYFTVMTRVVCDEGGYMSSYLGDGLMAIFGAPNTLDNKGALAAVRSARKMLKELESLNEQSIFKGVERIEIGIGIHSGEAIVGNLGCYEKMDYSIIGDTVNLASRIEGQTKLYKKPVLISEATYELVKNDIDSRFVATVQVKGREQAVNLYEV